VKDYTGAEIITKGSKFTVSIDQRIIAVTPPEVRETAASESKVIDVKGAKILIVDDNELNIKVASTLLRKYGLDIDSCTNGPDALRKLIEDKQQYDIVLLDDMMPRMSGREVLANLQKHPEYKIPTIALTANAIEGMKEEYLSAGFNDYLSKPIERGELERVLKKFISKQNMKLSNATTTDQVKSAIKLEDSLVLPKLVESPTSVEEKTPKKILIVDDDDMNLKVVSMMLKNYGYDLTLVSSGSEAIMKVMENTYDLILMDDMMPELDGSATLDNLKDIEGFNTPVVLLTANSEDDVRTKIEEHGFSGYLGKPINKEALNDITIKYLN
jgi:CheY-like chemotaxis protein